MLYDIGLVRALSAALVRGWLLTVEVVRPELIDVAQDDVLRPIGDEADPIIERLPLMFGQVRAALLHLDQDDRFPDVVCERGAAAVFGCFADAHLRGAANVER